MNEKPKPTSPPPSPALVHIYRICYVVRAGFVLFGKFGSFICFVLFCFVLVHMRDRVCWSVANRILFDKFLFLFFMF